MGYRGKVAAQEQARELRAEAWTLVEIANELGVSKSSVSLWVRDVQFTPNPRRASRKRGPSAAQLRKAAEIDELLEEGRRQVGVISDREFLIAGAMLYASEGGKRNGGVVLPNSDPRMIAFFCSWLRTFFGVDETRLRARLYLHQGLDIEEATAFWADLTGIPSSQFTKPYRAVPDPSIRRSKHPMGCLTVTYGCSRTHRAVMGLVHALLECRLAIPG
jgi:transcriptional regulator with XRE-family HTH domain